MGGTDNIERFRMPSLNAAYHGRRVIDHRRSGFHRSNLARALVDLGSDVLLVDSLIPGHGGSLFNIAGIEARLRVNIADIRQQGTHGLPRARS